MNVINIQITPDEFGTVAREAISHGFDVTSYLIKSAVNRRALPAPQQAPAPAPEKQQELAIITPKPEPAGSTGLFDDFGAA